jgi:hypothetical protein
LPWQKFFIAICLFAFPFSWALGAEDYSTWSYSSDLYLDTSPDGANIPGNVLNFPVLVRLKAADFPFAQALDSGRDLRFSKPDGSPLNFEIERWNATAKVADIWVKLDSVKGNFKGAFARMYWGKAGVTFPPTPISPNAVFDSINGFLGVWHMGGIYPTPRLSSVPNSPNAVPGTYDNDENTVGISGAADTLDGKDDYLQIWNPFTNLNRGFTFSIWAYPTAATTNARFMDFGSGAGVDNLVLMRAGNSPDLQFEAFNGTNRSAFVAAGVITNDQWQLFTVTVSGRSAKIYRNGSLVASSTLNDTISTTGRTSNYFGRSNWNTDPYFMGKLDEPTLANTERSADWIKLTFANQKLDQNLVSFVKPPPSCVVNFTAPADTTLIEGSALELAATADCATGYTWNVLSGPAPKILDPGVKVLRVYLPRVLRDTTVVYRFSATFGTEVRNKDVTVRISENYPDPVFTMPKDLTWNGKDSLRIQPTLTNQAELDKSKAPVLHYTWSFSGLTVDTAWGSDNLLLVASSESGKLAIDLCMDNGGLPSCQSSEITVNVPVRLALRLRKIKSASIGNTRDAKGRIASPNTRPILRYSSSP